MRSSWRAPFAILVGALAAHGSLRAGVAAEAPVRRTEVDDFKAVIATVEPIHLLPLRARIGGTVASVRIREGDRVTAGQEFATVSDQKLGIQTQALDERIRSLQAQRDKAQADHDRARDLSLARRDHQGRFRSDEDGAGCRGAQSRRHAQRSRRRGAAAGGRGGARFGQRPRAHGFRFRRAASSCPAKTIATVAEDQYILRLQLPERHAKFMRAGDAVQIASRSLDTAGAGKRMQGRVRIVYPEIQGGRVVADVEVDNLGDFSSANARVSTFPPASAIRCRSRSAVYRRAGIDFIRSRAAAKSLCRPAKRARRHRNPVRSRRRRCGDHPMKYGISGALTRAFIASPLTPLLLIASLSWG